MSTITPVRPDDEPEVDRETQAILDERLKTIADHIQSARPWREVLAESKARVIHPSPK